MASVGTARHAAGGSCAGPVADMHAAPSADGNVAQSLHAEDSLGAGLCLACTADTLRADALAESVDALCRIAGSGSDVGVEPSPVMADVAPVRHFIGQSLIAMKIQECEEAGYSFEKVIETVEAYIADQHTFFVLDNLETLRKNGRLSKVKALVASALKIKPVMGSTDEGAICQLDQARGMNKALVKMAQNIVDKTKDSENKILAISHCNCRERAVLLKNALEERMPVKHIVILDTAGVSSMYANDGGVIVAV